MVVRGVRSAGGDAAVGGALRLARARRVGAAVVRRGAAERARRLVQQEVGARLADIGEM